MALGLNAGSGPAASASAPRIGLLGGSFDPVHRGHLALARAALEQLSLEALWWLPAGQPWQKLLKARQPAAADHRVEMIRLALQTMPQPLRDRQRIETCEIARSGPTYTIDTLQELASRHPGVQWVLILGWDQLRGLPTWHRWREVLAAAQLAVARRPGFQGPPPAELGMGFGSGLLAIDLPPHEVSSTITRERAASGLPLHDQVTPEVERYIAAHGLYRPRA